VQSGYDWSEEDAYSSLALGPTYTFIFGGVGFALNLILYLLFWIMITFYTMLISLICIPSVLILNFKIFFSRTSQPNSIKLGTNCPWVREMQVCSNKGPGPLQMRDNHKIAKMEWFFLIFFSRTIRPLLTRLSTNHPLGGRRFKWVFCK
jgi:hypothetical protein